MDEKFAINWIRNKLQNNIVASSLKKMFKPPNHFDKDHECYYRLDNNKVNEKLLTIKCFSLIKFTFPLR